MWPEVKMTTKHRSETPTRCKHRVMTHQCEVFVLLESHMTESDSGPEPTKQNAEILMGPVE